MQIGDAVQLLGTVKDIVAGSALIDTTTNAPGVNPREYWVLEDNLSMQPTTQAAAPEEPAASTGTDKAEPPVHEPQHPSHTVHVEATKHTTTAKK